MNTHLSKGKLNIGLVYERARKEFLDLLDKCEGSKVRNTLSLDGSDLTSCKFTQISNRCQVIVWDDALAGPFGLIAEYSLLEKRDVLKMHPLKPDMKLQDAENVIFITRPQLKLMDYVIELIRR